MKKGKRKIGRGLNKIKGERIYKFVIALVAILYVLTAVYIIGVSDVFRNLDVFSKILTTTTTLVAAIAFWLQFRKTQNLNEANFILNLNNQFITNEKFTSVEQWLEIYFNSVVEGIGVDENAWEEHFAPGTAERQQLVNYLVYLEALASLERRGVINLDGIDELFAYRFFIAVNNPIVQRMEFLAYPDYYQGCFYLCKKWEKVSRKHKRAIPLEDTLLSNIDLAK